MEYNHKEIEEKWQKYWQENNIYRVDIDKDKEKFYVLDMFPYPSGAGLHVGHPLGYIASDIYSRYKRLKGFNVLHPMGYDAFGLPAEQYAIQTGQHPAKTTAENIKRYRSQLDKIGFSYDWNREVLTSDPKYYKWTQWVFIQLFKHWFNKETNKAESIDSLIQIFEKEGNASVNAASNCQDIFSAEEWNSWTEEKQEEMLLDYRLAYLSETMVNWCSELGTVLANDEVVNGYSVRGGFPVEQKKMKQWFLRVSAYAERLLQSLEKLEWSDSLKEIQRNWIGKSEGANVFFPVKDKNLQIEIFTTRPDTIFGTTFMVLAPESDLVPELTQENREKEVEDYLEQTKKRSERERMADVKTISGVFTGSYAINPLTKKEIPIWISDYVLAGYGTGAIMAVPAHDSRDFAFAKHFQLPIVQVVVANGDEPSDPKDWEESYDAKEGKMINSDFITDLPVDKAIKETIHYLEAEKLGFHSINYRLRDAIFSRQRYWGEPFPVYYKGETPYVLDESELPLELPEVDKFLPTEDGQAPLGRAKSWQTKEGYPYELSTMPGFAGSSAYYLRYMDPKNDNALVSREANAYWQDVDLYIGGTEHATGHLIYSRFWNKFLFDIGVVVKDEPFRKLINQGMIQGRSNLVYRVKNTKSFVSNDRKKEYETTEIHVDVNLVNNDILDIEAFKEWNPEYQEAEFILSEDGKYYCGWAVEKMSKSLYNVVNPDDIIEKYGADTLRLYEMFLGPIEQSKPWDTNGIDGVYKFLKKLWRLFYDQEGKLILNEEKANEKELKALHTLIKKIIHDIEHFSFNTGVSAFMICVNELSSLQCHKKEVLKDFLICLSPFAPHISEELWKQLGEEQSIVLVAFPSYDEKFLMESQIEYPVSFNGKMRFKLSLAAEMPKEEIEKTVLAHESSQKWLEGKTVRKIIIVPKKIINIVVS
jgi:leucyl-tRNA synthetase